MTRQVVNKNFVFLLFSILNFVLNGRNDDDSWNPVAHLSGRTRNILTKFKFSNFNISEKFVKIIKIVNLSLYRQNGIINFA